MSDNQTKFEELLVALKALGEPDYDGWARLVHEKARRRHELSNLADLIVDVDPYPKKEDQKSSLANFDCTSDLTWAQYKWMSAANGSLDFVMATGLYATALPVLGAVLTIIGVVLMVVNFFLSLFSALPPDPVETFLNSQGKPLLDSLDEAPTPRLEYTLLSAGSVPGKQVTTVAIQAANHTENEHLYVSLAATADAAITTSDFKSSSDPVAQYNEYDLEVAGCRTDGSTESSLPPLVLEPEESFIVRWTAEANKKGNSFVDVVEKLPLDKCHVQMPVVRV
ncbi:uncharacterized protein BO97DRAFT_428075 [Aspergillus homomorphus CBS 101889]|uniref:Uncharacterized protein n=1 Tax=Aspergillus homomorphus (strain CBS 101889) TaxID=1450537 RepID=A0A395HLE7_ASPHC|nr:hypothetical protein BO97DRAFT_428075 [Aspergillus homomorphus CBS 101889]RAL08762.1 hypothetical protein BO97DRAFT_428075 [Aspergillus homomorphus CBS 101889]